MDGCLVSTMSLPGSAHEEANEGKTIAHEVGHWFGEFYLCSRYIENITQISYFLPGLHHTFGDDINNQDCTGPGDYLEDTPAHLYTFLDEVSCSEEQDSCPNEPGRDPIHNHMTYSPEYASLASYFFS